MVRRKPRRIPLGTIWEISDELWRGSSRSSWNSGPRNRLAEGRQLRKMLNAIIFLAQRCQWDQLPERYGPKSTVCDWFQRWAAAGIFERIWAVLVAECDELGGVQWEWQPADAMLGKARFGGKRGQESHRPRKKEHQKAERLRISTASPSARWPSTHSTASSGAVSRTMSWPGGWLSCARKGGCA